ncbi:MAG: SapC family protein [Gammaproteobacteria bacterium]
MSEVIPLELSKYKNKKWHSSQTFRFAANDNYCPLSIREVSEAAAALPIVFIRQEDHYLLASLQGFNQGQNLLVNDNGMWLGMYCPMDYFFYPFCIITHEGKKIVCERSGSGLVSESVQGKAFFDTKGEKTPEFEELIQSLGQHTAGMERAAIITAQIAEFDLLVEWPINFASGEKKITLNGAYSISEEKLNVLSASQLEELRNSGALHVCYSQMVSTFNIKLLSHLHKSKAAEKSKADSPLAFDTGGSLNFDNF